MSTPLTMPPQPPDPPRPTMQPAIGANRLEQIIRDQERRISALERKLSQGNTDWTNLPLVNNWAAYSVGWTPRYRRMNGIVYVVGLVKNDVATLSGQVIGTVPPNFRMSPIGASLMNNQTAWRTGSGYAPARIDVEPSGNITIYDYGTLPVGFLSLLLVPWIAEA